MESQAFKKSPPPAPLRFTVLRHQRTQDTHWDLLLQIPGQESLLTWQVHRPPDHWPGQSIPAHRLPDHRALYLDYEGPVSNNRGQVTRYDTGTLDLESLAPGAIRFTLRGSRLQAVVTATRTADAAWVLRFLPPSAPTPHL